MEKKETFKVLGMSCAACQSRVEKAVNNIDGANANVNLLTNSMVVDYDDSKVTSANIKEAVEKAGYKCLSSKGEVEEKDNSLEENEEKKVRTRLISSFVFLLPLFYLNMGGMMHLPIPNIFVGNNNTLLFAFTQLVLVAPILLINGKIFINGTKAIINKSPNMDTLVALGSFASFFYGILAIFQMCYAVSLDNIVSLHTYRHNLYFEGAGMILVLITLGKYFEAKSKGKTKAALDKLISLKPKTALVLKDNEEVEIPIEDVQVGDIVVVKPGQKIPIDGVIIEGNAYVNQSAITGEGIPVYKKPKDTCLGATINTDGFLKIRITKSFDETTFSQIINLVKEATASKAPIAKIADKVAGIFVPCIVAISIITFIAWIFFAKDIKMAINCSISVLVISCPCALGLATPVALMVGMGKGASKGILIKNGEALEVTGKINWVVVDKTGTVTEGNPEVTKVISNNSENINSISLTLEEKSQHPLAKAICTYGKKNNGIVLPMEDFKTYTGKGVSGVINGTTYFMGNKALFDYNNISLSDFNIEEISKSAATIIIIGNNEKAIGVYLVEDKVRESSKKAIEILKNDKIKVAMITGDNEIVANKVAKEVGIETVVANALPETKSNWIKEQKSKGQVVAMVGDGINDAPALAVADIGIAIGNGTDVAIDSGDIILMKNDLLDVPRAIELSRAVIKNVKENLFWAFFYNVLGIPLAAGVFYPVFHQGLNPMIGAFAMSMSSLFVVSNALRLRKFKPKWDNDAEELEIKKEPEESNCQSSLKYDISIEGMMCNHCTGTVEKALLNLGAVDLKVSLENKNAVGTFPPNANEVIIKSTIEKLGYKVKSIKEI